MVHTELKKPADIKPWQVIAVAWVVVLCLVLVFARDFNSWAVAAEDTVTRTVALPVTGACLAVSEGAGIAGLLGSVENAIHPIYNEPWIVAARTTSQVAVISAVPPVLETGLAIAEGDTRETEQTAVKIPSKPQPTRILIIGDSTIESGLGTDLERRLEEFTGITVLRFGKHSTGLARPDYFNWLEKLAELQEEFNPDLVIAYFGDNDCQGLSTLEGAFITKFGTTDWDQIYGERVAAIVAQMQTGGSCVMIGMPIMRSKSFSNKVKRLNEVAEAATGETGGVFLPTWGMTSNEKGKYISSVEFNDRTRMIRAGDGIHFSTHGSAFVANELIKMLSEHFILELPAE